MSPVKTHQGRTPTNLGSLLDADVGMVELVAGDTRLVAHKAVLAARSPVLAAMLHDMSADGSYQLTIPDIEGPVLMKLVAYMYSLKVSELHGMGAQLLAAADHYSVVGLRAACEQLLALENVTG